jgi:hypothetical protein
MNKLDEEVTNKICPHIDTSYKNIIFDVMLPQYNTLAVLCTYTFLNIHMKVI